MPLFFMQRIREMKDVRDPRERARLEENKARVRAQQNRIIEEGNRIHEQRVAKIDGENKEIFARNFFQMTRTERQGYGLRMTESLATTAPKKAEAAAAPDEPCSCKEQPTQESGGRMWSYRLNAYVCRTCHGTLAAQ